MGIKCHAQLDSGIAATAFIFWVCNYESFVSSKIIVNNTNGAAQSFGIALVLEDDPSTTIQTYHYLYGPTAAITANTTVYAASGITLSRGDTLFIVGSAAGIVFTLFGEGQGEEG